MWLAAARSEVETVERNEQICLKSTVSHKESVALVRHRKVSSPTRTFLRLLMLPICVPICVEVHTWLLTLHSTKS